MYSLKPRSLRALRTCSGAIVFFSSLLHTSLDSDERRLMNSTQHSTRRSCASLATRTSGGSISLIILNIVDLGRETSSLDLPTMSIGSISRRGTESARRKAGEVASAPRERIRARIRLGAEWNRGARVRARGEPGTIRGW